ncbi:hypothetical protein ACFCZR_24330 [Streptomyces rubiginosohelvolus]|uniref:hypothetical protein n=1 Tax=Streptomyces rubiginosohelvolus TaxID=67362 RepID=UPI0035DC0675
MNTTTAPATAEPAATTYQFLVPGHITVSVPATSETEARNLLSDEGGDTLELDQVAPVKVGDLGDLSVHGIDLTPLAAKVDKIGEEIQDDSLPDADFSVSDIARVAARLLGDGWTSTCGAWAVSGGLSNDTMSAFYTLEVRDGTLQLLNEEYADAVETFGETEFLGTIAAQVARAVENDRD